MLNVYMYKCGIHSINARHKHDFHMPNANFSSYHKVLTMQESRYSVLFGAALNV